MTHTDAFVSRRATLYPLKDPIEVITPVTVVSSSSEIALVPLASIVIGTVAPPPALASVIVFVPELGVRLK
jgi:hypothetical protein